MADGVLRSIEISGNDGTGKNTACLGTLSELLNAQDIMVGDEVYTSDDFSIWFTDLPQYWGFGEIVKKMNSPISKPFFEKCTPEQELHVRKAFYAVDRLLALAVMDWHRRFDYRTVLHLSDRGRFSNVITHGVAMSRYGGNERFLESLSSVDDADRYYIDRLDPLGIMLAASTSALTTGERAVQLDELEAPRFQQLAEIGYEYLLSLNNSGLQKIISRTEMGWRPQAEIASDILDAAGVKIINSDSSINHRLEDFGPNFFLFNEEINRLKFMSMGLFVEALSPNADPRWMSYMRNFDRYIQNLYFASDDDLQHIFQSSKVDKKQMMVEYALMQSRLFQKVYIQEFGSGRKINSEFIGKY